MTSPRRGDKSDPDELRVNCYSRCLLNFPRGLKQRSAAPMPLIELFIFTRLKQWNPDISFGGHTHPAELMVAAQVMLTR